MSKKSDDKPIRGGVYWAAFSSAGYAVPFIGFSMQRKVLYRSYEARGFGTLHRHGYRVAKVRITPVLRRGKKTR